MATGQITLNVGVDEESYQDTLRKLRDLPAVPTSELTKIVAIFEAQQKSLVWHGRAIWLLVGAVFLGPIFAHLLGF